MVTLMALAALSAPGTLAYAETLMQQGEYFRAAGEYHRWLFENPTGSDRPKALYGLGSAYLKGQRYAQAEATFLQVPTSSEWSPRARFSLAKAYLGLQRVEEAHALFSELSGPLFEPAKAQLGLMAARSGDWQQARTHFASLASSDLEGLARRRLDTPSLSPGWIAARSVVPGGGQLSLGRHGDALNGFLFTSVSALASAYYFNRGNAVLGSTAGLLSLSFWGGSIYGAAVEARRINRQTEEAFVRQTQDLVETLGWE